MRRRGEASRLSDIIVNRHDKQLGVLISEVKGNLHDRFGIMREKGSVDNYGGCRRYVGTKSSGRLSLER